MTARPVQELPRLSVTVAEASRMTGVSKDILLRHINQGDLPAARPSRNWVIRLSDLDDWLEDQKNNR